ncbi:mucin-5AC [Drosophila serrata]|uniref:mucin-5AC n=1 Tax=Drosophila serrata TaxID=7274 RepID=UPI000A1D2A6D|nr:mucin-5AC [Drosophila serrata]
MTSSLSLGFAFAFVVAVQGWDYGLEHYHPAPNYHHGQGQQYELSTCPPSGPEGLVCAGITGSEPFTFPNACEVARFRTVTGKDWQIIHEGRCDNLEVCPGHCRNQYSPVCGKFQDERRNFNSECELQLVKCRTGDPWRKQHDGPCESRYPAGQSPRVRNYNPYAVNPYPSHHGYSGLQQSYGNQGSYGSQGAYGSQGSYHRSYESQRSFVAYGPYSPYAIASQSQPSFVSPPPPYKTPVYYPYEITWENLPTEFGIHSKTYENLPSEYPAPGSNADSYEKQPTDYATTSKPYEKPTYEKPNTYDNPTYEKPAYNSNTTSTTSTTMTSTTEKTTAAPTTTPQPEPGATTLASNLRQNIKINAVVEAPVTKSTNESSTTASPTKAPVTVKIAPLTKYATTASPQHATTTPRTTFEKVIKINAVQEKNNSTTMPTTTTKAQKFYPAYKSTPIDTTRKTVAETTKASLDKLIKINAVQETTSTTEKSTTVESSTEEPSTYKSYPTYQSPSSYSSYPTYQVSKSYYDYSPTVYTTTEKPKFTETTQAPLDKLIKINAVQETTSTTEEPTTEEPTTEKPTTYSSYPTAYNSYPSYQERSSYKTASPTYEAPSVYTTTEKPKVTETTNAPLDKFIKINAVQETTSTTEESTAEEPTTYKSYPASYKTYDSYPSYSTYKAPSTYKTTTTEQPKVTETTKAPLDKIIKINAVQETTSTSEEPTTDESTTEEQTTYKPYATSYKAYDAYPSYPTYKATKTETPEFTETTTPAFEKIIKINAVTEETSEEPTTSTEESTTISTEETTTISTEKPTTYPSYPTYQATSYPTYQAPSINESYTEYKELSYTSPGYKSHETYKETKTYPAYSGDSPVIVKTVNGSTFTRMYVEVPGKTGAKKFSLETSSGDNKSHLQQVYFLMFN